MRNRHDRLAKKLLRRTLETEGTFTSEIEVSPDAQRFDGYLRLPQGAHEQEAALPILLEYRAEIVEASVRTQDDEEFLMDTHDIVERIRDEGREEGRDEGRIEARHETRQTDLLAIYRARFGSVPRKVHAAVEEMDDDVRLVAWIELFAARSAAEIAQAVAPKKT